MNREPIADFAYAHGLLSGLLCGGADTHEPWQGFLDATGVFVGFDPQLLDSWWQQIREALSAAEFSYQLPLLDEEIPLTERTEALSQWCRGYRESFNSALARLGGEVSQDTSELIEHLGLITEVGCDERQDLEEQERALTELGEYLRLGACLSFLEQRDSNNCPKAPPQ